MFFDDSRTVCKGIAAVVIIGIVLRIAVGYFLTYNYDVYHWALTISNFEAGNGLYDVAGYYYSPVWGYILAVFAQFSELFGVDLLGERFSELLYTEDISVWFRNSAFVTTPAFNMAIMTMMAIFDLVNMYLIFRIVNEVFGDLRKAKICASLWFLCAFVIAVCSAGEMFDTISVSLTLMSVYLLIKDHELLAGMLFSAAVLLKFFPVFLIFLLVAYLIAKHRVEWKLRLAKAVTGAAAMAAVILAPNVLQGHFMDCFAFLLSRATTGGSSLFDILVQYEGVITFSAITIVQIYLAYVFVRKEHAEIDKDFLWFLFIGTLIIFINPASPQYIVLLAPFLIMAMVNANRRLMIPFIILCIGTTLFELTPLAMDLTAITFYTDILPLESWISFFDMLSGSFAGMNVTDVWAAVGGVVQYSAVVISVLIIVKELLLKSSSRGTDQVN